MVDQADGRTFDASWDSFPIIGRKSKPATPHHWFSLSRRLFHTLTKPRRTFGIVAGSVSSLRQYGEERLDPGPGDRSRRHLRVDRGECGVQPDVPAILPVTPERQGMGARRRQEFDVAPS